MENYWRSLRSTNGLRQGCTMATTLFNLFACVVAEGWEKRIKEIADVGTLMLY